MNYFSCTYYDVQRWHGVIELTTLVVDLRRLLATGATDIRTFSSLDVLDQLTALKSVGAASLI